MLHTGVHMFRKSVLPLLIVLFAAFTSPAQVNAFFNHGVFNSPGSQPFIETYLTIVGSSLHHEQTGRSWNNSVNINLTIMKDSLIVKANKYNLIGPSFDTASQAPVFIDNQRYPLANGQYTLKIRLTDANDANSKALEIVQPVTVNFPAGEMRASSIQPIESFSKAQKQGPLTKSGLDLVPYNVNYYPETSKEIAFYMEVYNADLTLGKDEPFVLSYYIEMDNNREKLGSYGGFQKQKAASVNPMLGRQDISKLGTGNYNLVIELKDKNNVIQLSEKYFFQRLNRAVDIVALQNYSERQNVAEYFGNVNSADTLQMFVECLWPIADNVDKERIINQALVKKPDLMKKFVIDFWQRRAADTANPLKMWATYYQSVQQAMVLFKCGKQKGYYTERGRVYLQYGPPNQRSQQMNEPNTFPYEIWQYYRTTDATNGQFFSNRKFVFVNKNLGDDCYNLVHSDMRGEINNPRWQFEVTRRNNNGIANPDNNTPAGTQFNQFNDIYSNPR
jgi:GWxTD domain-containing protein